MDFLDLMRVSVRPRHLQYLLLLVAIQAGLWIPKTFLVRPGCRGNQKDKGKSHQQGFESLFHRVLQGKVEEIWRGLLSPLKDIIPGSTLEICYKNYKIM